MAYKVVVDGPNGVWVDLDTGESFFRDENNVAYRKFKEWVDEGNTPEAADPMPVQYSMEERTNTQIETTDATPAELWRYTTDLKTGYDIVARLIAVDRGNGAVRKQSIDATVTRIGTSPSLVGRTDSAPHVTSGQRGTDAGIGGWALNPSFDGTDLVLSVVGAAGRTIDWRVTITMVRFSPEGIIGH